MDAIKTRPFESFLMLDYVNHIRLGCVLATKIPQFQWLIVTNLVFAHAACLSCGSVPGINEIW